MWSIFFNDHKHYCWLVAEWAVIKSNLFINWVKPLWKLICFHKTTKLTTIWCGPALPAELLWGLEVESLTQKWRKGKKSRTLFNMRQTALHENPFTWQKNSAIWTMTMSRLWCKFDWIIRGRSPFTGNRWKINLSAMVTDASDYSSQHWLIWFPIEFGGTLSRIWKSNTRGEKGGRAKVWTDGDLCASQWKQTTEKLCNFRMC